jgi:hypothetical protein
MNVLTFLQDGLDDIHRAGIPDQKAVKADSTRDMLTVFTDKVSVKFTHKNGGTETVKGRWCLICKYVLRATLDCSDMHAHFLDLTRGLFPDKACANAFTLGVIRPVGSIFVSIITFTRNGVKKAT